MQYKYIYQAKRENNTMKEDTANLKNTVNKIRHASLELLNVANILEELSDFKHIEKFAKNAPTIISALKNTVHELVEVRFNKALSAVNEWEHEAENTLATKSSENENASVEQEKIPF